MCTCVCLRIVTYGAVGKRSEISIAYSRGARFSTGNGERCTYIIIIIL